MVSAFCVRCVEHGQKKRKACPMGQTLVLLFLIAPQNLL